MTVGAMIDLDAIRNATVNKDPYTYIVVSNFLVGDAIPALRRDFPLIQKPGFLTLQDVEMKGSFGELIAQLESSEMARAVSDKLGIDLDPLPRLTTVRRLSQLKDGRIHTDSESKLATFLVYMNDNWADDAAGRLRVLRGPTDFDDMAAEIPPTMGSAFGFKRADNSWHGHKPYAGERRVVQVTWLRDVAELERKKKRNSIAQFFKGLFGR
jgi:SM-20-related protein